MTQPHHHVFNALQAEINRVDVQPLLPLLLERGVFKREEEYMFCGKIGTKVLTGFLRSKDYDTFLTFLSCICDHTKELSIVTSIKDVIEDFDKRHGSCHALKVQEMLDSHTKAALLVSPPPPPPPTAAPDKELSSLSLEETVYTEVPTALSQAAIYNKEDLALPSLQYLYEPETFTLNECNHYSYRKHEQDFGFIIEGHPDDPITLRIGLCTHGPFAIPDIYRVVTCFVCIAASTKLTKSVRITMQHCLLMPKYEQSSSVLVLHADHRIVSISDCYVFSAHFDCGENHKRKLYPNLSPDSSLLWFEVEDLCILCGVLEGTTSESTSKGLHDTNPELHCPSPHSEEHTAQRTDSFGSTAPTHEFVAKQASLESQDTKGEHAILKSPRRAKLKRQHPLDDSCDDGSKRSCKPTIEYVLLLIEPVVKGETFSIYIFVCENCLTSLEECIRQGCLLCKCERHHIKPTPLNGTFTGFEIQFSIDNENFEWKVDPKKSNSTVREKDLHKRKADVGVYAKLNLFPPRMEYIIRPLDCCRRTDLAFYIMASGFKCSDCTIQAYFTITAPGTPSNYLVPISPDLRNKFHSLPIHQKQSAITDEQTERALFLKLYMHVKDWKRIGQALGLPESSIEAVGSNHGMVVPHLLSYEILHKWYIETAPSQRTLEFIAKALIEAYETEALHSLIEYLLQDKI